MQGPVSGGMGTGCELDSSDGTRWRAVSFRVPPPDVDSVGEAMGSNPRRPEGREGVMTEGDTARGMTEDLGRPGEPSGAGCPGIGGSATGRGSVTGPGRAARPRPAGSGCGRAAALGTLRAATLFAGAQPPEPADPRPRRRGRHRPEPVPQLLRGPAGPGIRARRPRGAVAAPRPDDAVQGRQRRATPSAGPPRRASRAIAGFLGRGGGGRRRPALGARALPVALAGGRSDLADRAGPDSPPAWRGLEADSDLEARRRNQRRDRPEDPPHRAHRRAQDAPDP